MQLTGLQISILNHRAEMPDCVYEAVQDDHPEWDIDDIYIAVESVMSKMLGVFELNDLSNIERAVLFDLIDGSTYVDIAESCINTDWFDETGIIMTHQRYNGMRRSYNKLVEIADQLI